MKKATRMSSPRPGTRGFPGVSEIRAPWGALGLGWAHSHPQDGLEAGGTRRNDMFEGLALCSRAGPGLSHDSAQDVPARESQLCPVPGSSRRPLSTLTGILIGPLWHLYPRRSTY